MKMRKIFAAGIAATLAVTSLASVAGATLVPRTFDMRYSTGIWIYDGGFTGEKAEQLGDNFKFVTPASGAKPVNYKIAGVDDLAGGATTVGDTNNDGTVNYQDFDAFVPLKISASGLPASVMSGLKVKIEGRKYDNGNLINVTQTATLIPVASVNGDSTWNYVLPIYVGTSPDGAFMPEIFSAVDRIEVQTDALKSVVLYDLDYDEYTEINTNKGTLKTGATTATHPIDIVGSAAKYDDWYNTNGWTTAKVSAYGTTDAGLTIELAAGADAALTTNLLYKITAVSGDADNGSLALTGTAIPYAAVTPADNANAGVNLIHEINVLLKGGLTAKWTARGNGVIDNNNLAWMPVTGNNDGVIYREEVKLLSSTDDYNSYNIWDAANRDYNQTYNEDTTENFNRGTNPEGFAGLASQIADHFNGQLNGKIIFYFRSKVDATGDNGPSWYKGGIPSTEVGLKNYWSTGAQEKDFALFFNYNTTTGSLQADAKLNPYDASVEFDITAVLQALKGQTVGTIHDVYYALTSGAEYNNNVLGLYVEKVELQYEKSDAAAADAATDETKTEEPAKEEPKSDDKADEIEVEIPDDTEEPDDATVVIEEPDDSTTVVDNTNDNTVVVNPGTTTPAADENPHTGAALAVVPAALAAAAMLISKKRK